jgi:uncharacterized membrane protein
MLLKILTVTVAIVLCGLAIVHAYFDGSSNRIQRLLLLVTLFIYAIFLEYIGIVSGHHYYAEDIIMFFGIVPISIPLAWVGIIYSVMIITERLELSLWMRILTTTLIALSLDWGMDPIAVDLGLWTWTYVGGSFFGIPTFNFIGWFIIPIAYQISYNLSWKQEKKMIQILNISEIDNQDSWLRKLFTIFLVVPLGLSLMMFMGLVALYTPVYNLPLVIVIIFEVITIGIASMMISLKRYNLKRTNWIDLIPPIILIYVAYSYTFLGFISSLPILGLHMVITGIPMLLAFVFTLRKK